MPAGQAIEDAEYQRGYKAGFDRGALETHAKSYRTSPVVSVWKLNGDIDRMELCVNSAPLKGYTHIYQQLFCVCGVSLPLR